MGLPSSILALALTLSAAGAEIEAAKELAQRAAEARSRGELEIALELLDKAYALTPAPPLRHNAARVLEELGRYRDAAAAYRAVIEDPGAPEDLRALDAERLAQLTPKLTSAWVIVEPDAALLIDGRSPGSQEHALDAGAHVIESRSAGSVAIVRTRAFAAGERQTLSTVEGRARPGDALIRLDDLTAPISSITVDGYAVRADPSTLTALHLEPGRHTLEVSFVDGSKRRASVELGAGVAVALGDQLAAPIGNASLVAPAPTPERAWAPWVVAASGVVAAGAGGILVATAGSDRAEIERALASEAVVRSFTFREAAELEASANTRATLGAIALGLGAAAIVSGLGAWWWSSP